MAKSVFLGAAAAFGVFCALWAIFGGLFSGRSGGVLVCLCHPGKDGLPLIRRFLLLQDLGLLRTPLLVAGSTLSDAEQAGLRLHHRHLEFCSLEQLPIRLELERSQSNGTGT